MLLVKKQLFEQLALIASSLGSPQRLEMLDYLAQAERSVDELSKLADLSIANTSRHLQILKQHGLVSVRKQGKSRLYQVAGKDVIQLITSLRSTAETHLAEVNRLTAQFSTKNTPTMTSVDLVSKMDDKNLLILDVRPKKEFLQGHILGATNIQPEDIKGKTKDIPKNKTVVAYCRGPYCLYSYEMVDSLHAQGIDAFRLEEGYPEWKAAGLPFEQQ